MLTPKQIKTFEAFLRRPYQELTYKKIKEYSKEKSNSIIQKSIAKFLKEDLVNKTNIGNINLYQINLENSLVFSYFNILIQEKLSKPVKLCLKNIREELSETEFLSLIIFGSYADGKQTDKSDLDLALFVNSEEDKRNCRLGMKSAELKSILNLDTQVFTKSEMLQMLNDKKENLGKQIAKKHLVIINPLIFYSIIKEGINNGFKIVY